MVGTADAQVSSPRGARSIAARDTDVVCVTSVATCDAPVAGPLFALSHCGQQPAETYLFAFQIWILGNISSQGRKQTCLLFFTRALVRHERGKIWIDDVVVVKGGQTWLSCVVKILVERGAVVVLDMAHMLVP
jgi:hypothetical protein